MESINTILSLYYYEMKKCSTSKAYMSATVMMGSLMETIFLDWLTELYGVDGKNFFEEDTVPTGYRKNPRKFQNLKTYTNWILKHVDSKLYDNFKNDANRIRIKRNHVHPRVLSKNLNDVIDETEYIQLCECFKRVVETRHTLTTTQHT